MGENFKNINDLFEECFERKNEENLLEKNYHGEKIEYKRILAILIGCIVSLILMKIEKCGWKNIAARILTSVHIFFIDRMIIKNNRTQLDYLLSILFPSFSSLVFVIGMNQNHMNILKNIFDYINLRAGIDNYKFLKNITKNNILK